MARLGRYFLPDQPLRVIQRGNNREAIFFGEDDHARYRDWLAAAAVAHGCAIHALSSPQRDACGAPEGVPCAVSDRAGSWLRRWPASSDEGGWALGDARFRRQIAKALGRRVAPLPRGRAPKAKAE